MSKLSLLIMAFIVPLWVCEASAQERVVGIEELFDLADRSSKSIRISETALSRATETVKSARSSRLPSLDAALSFNYLGDGWIADRDFSNGTGAPMPHYGNNFSIEATQVIYAGGALSAGIESAELQRDIAELSLQDNKQNIRFLILGYYLELYKLNNQLLVYEKNIEQTELLLRQIRARHGEGVALHNDITRYELELQTLRLSRTQAENNRLMINYQLVSTLSLPAGTVIVPDSALLSTHVPALTQEQWQERAADGQPQLKIADLSVGVARSRERITRAEQLPQIALVAVNNFNGPITIEVPALNKNFNYWYVGIGIQYSFGSLWKSRSKTRADRYATLQAQQSLELAREEIQIAVNAAYIMLQQAYEQLRTQEKSVELAVQNYRVINNRYLHDLALITDMLDAGNSQLNAELSLANARINVVYSYYKMQRVAGVL